MPPAVAAIARKALTSQVDARFQSAAQMRDAMEAAMIDAKIQTTPGDVATFLSQQLSDRTAKRRQVIDIALAAAAERERIVEVLRPHMERTGSGLTSAPDSERTAAEAPGALRVATVPEGAPSNSATHRTPAGTVASEVIELPRSRTGLVMGLVAMGVAAAAGVAFVTLRQPTAAAARAPQGSPLPAASSSATATPSASVSAAAPSSSIPVFSLSDLPKATTAQPAPVVPPRPVWQAPKGPVVAPTAAPKKKVDDGF